MASAPSLATGAAMFDVVIIGAGPAGSTLARLLPERLRVLLVDQRRLDLVASEDPSAAKLCGGLLAPAAQRALAHQGLGVPSGVLSGPQLFAVRTLDADAGLERLYQRHYLNVDRDAFDRWLCSLVPSTVTRAMGWSLVGFEHDASGAMTVFRTPGGGRASARASVVVGADGATSLVRRLAYREAPAPRRYVAVQGVFETAPAQDPYYGALFDSSITDHYGWTIPKGDTLVAGVAVPEGLGVVAAYDAFVGRARASGFRLGRELGRGSAAVARPIAPAQMNLGAGRVLLAGEAAGLISPSSAEGISYA
ncbi:MAG: oxidoreductase, partial [Actinobacteria bacterium]